MHWPERVMNMFGQRGVSKIDHQWQDNFFEVLSIYDGLIKEGKIKHIGVSNENPYGVMKFLNESEKHNLPRIATIQNPYSLLNRLFEVGLSEICLRENVGLMAYSPLAFSFLTGKHLKGIQPNSRLGLFPQFSRYSNENCFKATKLYQELAHANGLTLTQMALAFVNQQDFVMSTIIGATTTEQLQENIASFEVRLSPEVIAEVNKIQVVFPDPAP
jgi:aryl-alcohol dehydrogenase-like predicted oxidoreductase